MNDHIADTVVMADCIKTTEYWGWHITEHWLRDDAERCGWVQDGPHLYCLETGDTYALIGRCPSKTTPTWDAIYRGQRCPRCLLLKPGQGSDVGRAPECICPAGPAPSGGSNPHDRRES